MNCGILNGMIQLTNLSGKKILVNQDLIVWIENTPDSILVMAHGQRLPVLENAEDIQQKIIAFKNKLNSLEKRTTEVNP